PSYSIDTVRSQHAVDLTLTKDSREDMRSGRTVLFHNDGDHLSPSYSDHLSEFALSEHEHSKKDHQNDNSGGESDIETVSSVEDEDVIGTETRQRKWRYRSRL